MGRSFKGGGVPFTAIREKAQYALNIDWQAAFGGAFLFAPFVYYIAINVYHLLKIQDRRRRCRVLTLQAARSVDL